VVVLVNLAGASVYVDNRQVGTTPLTEALSRYRRADMR